jgi:hypothetical protein
MLKKLKFYLIRMCAEKIEVRMYTNNKKNLFAHAHKHSHHHSHHGDEIK